MNFLFSSRAQFPFLLFPDHGGDTVSGGGHPADAPVPATEAIDDAFAQDARGHGNTPGVGVPGSRTNPISAQEEIRQLAEKFWEEEGRPEGRADDHWHRAEAEWNRRQN